MTKVCTKCKIDKSLQSFPKKGNEPGRKPRLDSRCKKCKNGYGRHYHRKKREEKWAQLPSKHVPAPGFKTCTKCKIDKSKIDGFFCMNRDSKDGFNPQCKECVRAPLRIKAALTRLSRPKRELSTKTDSVYQRERRKVDPLYRLAKNLRGRTNEAVRRGNFTKSSSLSKYFGCSMKKFKAYTESFWQPGMTWDNYGNGPGFWNLDHTVPLASATTEKRLYRLCHYKNIKPMWHSINNLKSDMMPDQWAAYKLRHNIDERFS